MDLHTVYLSAGSNLGDREAFLRGAVDSLGRNGVEAVRVSRLFETEPVGYLDQPWFLNIAVEARTSLSPESLLDCCQRIEKERGRVRTVAGGPRTLDIDILLYDDLRLNSHRLQIPHPRMVNRRFVLEPMAEIAGSLMHPVLQTDFRTLLVRCDDPSRVKPYSPEALLDAHVHRD